MTTVKQSSIVRNNCAACKHKEYPDGGWCYMFRLAPTRVCAHHTGKKFNYPIYRSVVEKVMRKML